MKISQLPWIKDIVDWNEAKKGYEGMLDQAISDDPQLKQAKGRSRNAVFKLVGTTIGLPAAAFLLYRAQPEKEVADPKPVPVVTAEKSKTENSRTTQDQLDTTMKSLNADIYANYWSATILDTLKVMINDKDIDVMVKSLTSTLSGFYLDKAYSKVKSPRAVFRLVYGDDGTWKPNSASEEWFQIHGVPFYGDNREELFVPYSKPKESSETQFMGSQVFWLALADAYNSNVKEDEKLDKEERNSLIHLFAYHQRWIVGILEVSEERNELIKNKGSFNDPERTEEERLLIFKGMVLQILEMVQKNGYLENITKEMEEISIYSLAKVLLLVDIPAFQELKPFAAKLVKNPELIKL